MTVRRTLQLDVFANRPGAGSPLGVSQGRELRRDGRVEVRVDAEGEVWIGGQVQAVIRGSVDW